MRRIVIWMMDHPITCLVSALLLVLTLAIMGSLAAEEEWRKYAAEHHCVEVGRKEGQVGIGVGSDGRVVTTIGSDQKIYHCDGGEIRIR
jgi:hypothetical protein